MQENLEGFVLSNGTFIYTIIKEIGRGASSIVYRACYTNEGRKNYCIVKEFYPSNLVIKRVERSVFCEPKDNKKYIQLLNKFKDSIDVQNEIRNNGVASNQTASIMESFAENNTYYIVMSFMEGMTFDKCTHMSLYKKIKVCKSIASFVLKCHNAGYLCMDIKPQNVYIIPETPEYTMFFDFDSIGKAEDIKKSDFSYTNSWAAPEQIIPEYCNKISERTDIYVLGEIIFWAVFQRHSREEEHRLFSDYEFDKYIQTRTLNTKCCQILSDIFHNTIRTSIKNRYSDVKELINKLDEFLYNCIPESHIDYLYQIKDPSQYFVGREEIIDRIHRVLGTNSNKMVFIVGKEGVGKKEITRKYIAEYKNEYSIIVKLKYTTDFIRTMYYTNLIKNTQRLYSEDMVEVCLKKINILKDVFSNAKVLVIIENFDKNLDEFDDNELKIWNQFIQLPCNIILTSLKKQSIGEQILIDNLNSDEIKDLFFKIVEVNNENASDIDKLLEYTGNSAVFISLIAKKKIFENKSCADILDELVNRENQGLKYFKKNINTDNDILRQLNILDYLFASEEEYLFFQKLCILPADDISEEQFLYLYYMEDDQESHELLNGLIKKGFIDRSGDRYKTLYVNSYIKNMILSYIVSDKCEFDILLKDILEKIVDNKIESYKYVNQSFCNEICKNITGIILECAVYTSCSAQFVIGYIYNFYECISINELDKYFDYIFDVYKTIPLTEEAVLHKKIADILYLSYCIEEKKDMIDVKTAKKNYLCTSKAKSLLVGDLYGIEKAKYYLKIIRMSCRKYNGCIFQFLKQRVLYFISVMNFASSLFDMPKALKKDSGNYRENELSIYFGSGYDEDDEIEFIFSSYMNYMNYHNTGDIFLSPNSLLIKFTNVFNEFRFLFSFVKNKSGDQHELISEILTDPREYYYYNAQKKSTGIFKTIFYTVNLMILNRCNINAENHYNIVNSRSIIKKCISSGDYDEAELRLNILIKEIGEKNLSFNYEFRDLYILYAYTLYYLGKYELAIQYIKIYLTICEEINLPFDFENNLFLERLYIKEGDINTAEALHASMEPLFDIINKSEENTWVLGELLYNKGLKDIATGNNQTAIDSFNEALGYYASSMGKRLRIKPSFMEKRLFIRYRDFINVARIHFELGNIYNGKDTKKCKRNYNMAKKGFVRCLGKNHPETVVCINRMKNIVK